MPLTQTIIDEVVDRYWREVDRYIKLAEYVADKCRQDVVQDNAIRASVSWRAKSRQSLNEKLGIWMNDETKSDIDSVEKVFKEISDLAGVRISTYVENERDKIVQIIKRVFVGPNEQGVGIQQRDREDSFYRAIHCQVVLREKELVGRYENLGGLTCEIQVTSLLAHVWNEIDHDLTYKPKAGNLSEVEKNLLKQLGHMTKAGDISIVELYRATQKRIKMENEPFEDVYDFVERTQDKFPNSTNFGANAGRLLDALRKLSLDTPILIDREILASHNGNHEAVAKGLLNTLEKYLSMRGEDFYLNEQSSDLLMVLLLDTRAKDVIDAFPAGFGQGRPARIRSIAYRYVQMLRTGPGLAAMP